MKKDDALNIRSDSKDPRGRILANPTHTPFQIGKLIFLSVESALQGIKFEDEKKQRKVFTMRGKDALKAGREITNSIKDGEEHFVYWNSRQIVYNSDEHRFIIGLFLYAKMWQNPEVQEALLSTKGTFIYHNVGLEHPNTSLPEKFYIKFLLSLRGMLEGLRDIK